jgi:hypothetical protein
MKLSAAIAIALWTCICIGCQSVPTAFKDDPEFGGFVREAKGRYLGCLGYALSIPGIAGSSDNYSSKDVFVLPGPGDFWRSEEDRRYVERSWKFAEKYNLWLLSTKKPNKAPEPTSGSVTPRAIESTSK